MLCGNFLPLDGDITSTSPLSTSCPALELLRCIINPLLVLLSFSVSAAVTELLTLSFLVVVEVEAFCRLTGSADVADCLEAVRLMDPGVDGAGIEDVDDGLADFALELLPPLAAVAAEVVVLPLRLSG